MLILFVLHLFVSKHNYILQVYVLNAEYSFQETLDPSHHIMLSVLTSLTCPIMPLWPGSSDDIWSWSRPFWSVLKLTLATRSCYQTQAGYNNMAQADLSGTVKSGCSSRVSQCTRWISVRTHWIVYRNEVWISIIDHHTQPVEYIFM